MAEQELELIHFSHLQSTFMQQGVGMKWNHSQPCGFFSYTTGRHCCRKGDPFQGLKLGSCLTLGNELSEETHVLTKREILLGKGARVEGRRGREPRRAALPCGSQSRVLW